MSLLRRLGWRRDAQRKSLGADSPRPFAAEAQSQEMPGAITVVQAPYEAGKDSFMTAYPERVSLERVLGQAMPPLTGDRLQTRTWHVVQADGSKTALTGSSEEPDSSRPVSGGPALFVAPAERGGESKAATASAKGSSRQLLRRLATLGLLGGEHPPSTAAVDPAFEAASSRPNIAMPKASPTLGAPEPIADGADSPVELPGAPRPERKAASAAVGLGPSGEPRTPVSLPTAPECERDLQLMRVIDAWPALPPRAREAVIAVIEATCTR